MYQCRDCGLIFEEPKTYTENLAPGGVWEQGFDYSWSCCPRCEGEYREYTGEQYEDDFDEEL